MLPFARMVKYGNIKPTLPEIKKLEPQILVHNFHLLR